jgi:hypothetical protein
MLKESFQARVSYPFGMVSKEELNGKEIIVNIFNAAPGAKVECTVDDGKPFQMQQKKMKDPFILKYLEDRESFPGWIDDAVEHKHIWSAPFPEKLSSGTHTIRINATDSKGYSYSTFSIFNIE